MNWKKWEKETKIVNKNTDAGTPKRPIFQRDENKEIEIVDYEDIQEEINSHLEETLLEPQIVKAGINGESLKLKHTGEFIDLSDVGTWDERERKLQAIEQELAEMKRKQAETKPVEPAAAPSGEEVAQ